LVVASLSLGRRPTEQKRQRGKEAEIGIKEVSNDQTNTTIVSNDD